MRNEVEEIAKQFHERYEKLAPKHNYTTRKKSAVPWEDVPENNKSLMLAVVEDLLDSGVIQSGTKPDRDIVARLRHLGNQ
jgi:hypothetical protein